MSTSKRQSGVTLITSLIMLVVLTLLVLAGIRASNTNLRIAGNMQLQEEAVSAAQQAIEQVISTNFTAAPAAKTVSIDIDNNGSTDYTATIDKPICQANSPVLFSELNTANLEDKSCFGSSTSSGNTAFGPGNTPSTTTSTWCVNQRWDIKADVTDSNTGASTTLHQGVYLRTKAGTACL
jgi:Tfp pilus assembly protein PilX